jgi:hypothetical protein
MQSGLSRQSAATSARSTLGCHLLRVKACEGAQTRQLAFQTRVRPCRATQAQQAHSLEVHKALYSRRHKVERPLRRGQRPHNAGCRSRLIMTDDGVVTWLEGTTTWLPGVIMIPLGTATCSDGTTTTDDPFSPGMIRYPL